MLSGMSADQRPGVALVTGAGGGIGAAIIGSLAASGLTCIALDISLEAAERVSVQTGGAPVEPVECDVADEEAAREAVASAIRRHGGLDVLVNAAGWPGPLQGAAKVDPVQWRRITDINYHGTVSCTAAALPTMRSQGAGRVINIASMSGTQGARGQAAYSGAKAAVLGFTYAIAKEMFRFGVTVNAITPGFIRTPMMDLPPEVREAWRLDQITLGGEMGEPEDVADLVAFLASDRARYITGAVIPIDGGAHLGYP
jgi:NAD(P)-dependent dehydrogenase (short-subunit alcohol dehydrogenase family)